MSGNLNCKFCDKVLVTDFEHNKIFEGTFCRKHKETNPNCKECKLNKKEN